MDVYYIEFIKRDDLGRRTNGIYKTYEKIRIKGKDKLFEAREYTESIDTESFDDELYAEIVFKNSNLEEITYTYLTLEKAQVIIDKFK